MTLTVAIEHQVLGADFDHSFAQREAMPEHAISVQNRNPRCRLCPYRVTPRGL